jgi:hypothetical protein
MKSTVQEFVTPRGAHRGPPPRGKCAPLDLALSIPPAIVTASPARGKGRGLPFWMALAKDCAVPAGESPSGLVSEAVSFLGSPDSAWRDDVGYGVVAACVYQKKLLTLEERRELVARLSANLRRGIGETGTDSVLLRSFSALALSVLAALEDVEPALDAAGYRKLLDDALAWSKMTAPGTPVFTHGHSRRPVEVCPGPSGHPSRASSRGSSVASVHSLTGKRMRAR